MELANGSDRWKGEAYFCYESVLVAIENTESGHEVQSNLLVLTRIGGCVAGIAGGGGRRSGACRTQRQDPPDPLTKLRLVEQRAS